MTKRVISSVNKNIGERIKNLRIERGLNQTDFGKLFHLSQNDVTQIERGYKTVSYNVLIDISKYFGETTDFIIKGNGVSGNRPNLQYICDYTGLSEEAIEMLHALFNYKDFNHSDLLGYKETIVSKYNFNNEDFLFFIDFINSLICNTELRKCICQLYLRCCQIASDSEIAIENYKKLSSHDFDKTTKDIISIADNLDDAHTMVNMFINDIYYGKTYEAKPIGETVKFTDYNKEDYLIKDNDLKDDMEKIEISEYKISRIIEKASTDLGKPVYEDKYAKAKESAKQFEKTIYKMFATTLDAFEEGESNG